MSKDNKIKLIFIVINDCKEIYNGITFNRNLNKKYKKILNKKSFNLIITVVKNDCFSEFFYNNWRFFNIGNKIPVISVKNSQYFTDKYIYDRENKIINIILDKQNTMNFFSQLIYSLIVKPEIIIYSSFPNEELSLIKELCDKFFPYTTIKIVHPNKNNLLVPLKDIKTSNNKVILFILDDEIINLENLNFFMDLSYTTSDNSLLFCTSTCIENEVTNLLFPYELKNKIQEKKQACAKHKENIDISKYLKNLALLESKIFTIADSLKYSTFHGNPIRIHKEMIYQLEKNYIVNFYQ